MVLNEYLKKQGYIKYLKEEYDNNRINEIKFYEAALNKGITEEDLEEALGDWWERMKAKAKKGYEVAKGEKGSEKYSKAGDILRGLEKEKEQQKYSKKLGKYVKSSSRELRKKKEKLEKELQDYIDIYGEDLSGAPSEAKEIENEINKIKKEIKQDVEQQRSKLSSIKQQEIGKISQTKQKDIEHQKMYKANQLKKRIAMAKNSKEVLNDLADYIKNTKSKDYFLKLLNQENNDVELQSSEPSIETVR